MSEQIELSPEKIQEILASLKDGKEEKAPEPQKISLKLGDRTFEGADSADLQRQLDEYQAQAARAAQAKQVEAEVMRQREAKVETPAPEDDFDNEFKRLGEKKLRDGFKYAVGRILKDEYGVDPAELKRTMEISASNAQVIAATAFTARHPEFEQNLENAAAISRVMQGLNMSPYDTNHYEAAYTIARQQGLVKVREAEEESEETVVAPRKKAPPKTGGRQVDAAVEDDQFFDKFNDLSVAEQEKLLRKLGMMS
jgi:hypothetical protein